jgi:hypothetical protein
MTVGVDAVRHRVVVDEDAGEVASARSAPSVWNDIPSGCPWLHRGRSPGCPSKWRRPDPVLEMSQRTESRPGAWRAGDSANHLTEGSRIRCPVNTQPRGLITPTMRPMMSPGRDSQIRSTGWIVGAPESAWSLPRGLIIPTMRPMMSVGHGSHSRPTSGRNREPESASSQLRGLIISVPGVHQWRTSPSPPFTCSPLVRRISLRSVCCPMSGGAVDRPAKVSIPVYAVIDDDIRPGHSANEPPTSPVPASGRGSTVASSRRCQVEREGTLTSPEGSRSNAPSLGLHSLTGLRKSGSKMVEQVPCSRRRCRWPQSGPVPEVPSGALRWAS